MTTLYSPVTLPVPALATTIEATVVAASIVYEYGTEVSVPAATVPRVELVKTLLRWTALQLHRFHQSTAYVQ